MAPLLLRGIHCILLVLPAGSAVCAETAPPPTAATAATLEQPVADSNPWRSQQRYDEVIAVLPRERAALASVVLAEVNIALHSARRHARQTLCAGHQWTPNGALLLQYGPQLVQPTSDASHPRSWIYRAFRRPGNLSCKQVTRARFFLEMSRHLPDWITVRPAGQEIAYRQGLGVLPPQQARVAAR